jgi:hypothetical protein
MRMSSAHLLHILSVLAGLLLAACTYTGHADLVPVIEPQPSPLSSKELIEWPRDGDWVEIVLSDQGQVLKGVHRWVLRLRVTQAAEILEAIEVRDDSILALEVQRDTSRPLGFHLSHHESASAGFYFGESLVEGESSLFLRYKADWEPVWVIQRN